MNFDASFDLDYDHKEHRNRIIRIILKIIIWILILGSAITAGWAITKYCFELTNMIGNSMNETLSDGDRVMINRMSYIKNDPGRFDVIVFEKNGKEHSYYGIRRVIGLPGETVQIIDGVVFINGEILDEIINVEPMNVSGLASEPVVLDDDEFFVLGDNRNNSEDSRFTSMGNISRDEIIGKAWIRTNKFGFIGNFNKKEG